MLLFQVGVPVLYFQTFLDLEFAFASSGQGNFFELGQEPCYTNIDDTDDIADTNDPNVKINSVDTKMCWAPELEPKSIKSTPETRLTHLELMKEIILEKLQLIQCDQELNKGRIRELWDDIQILAFMEKETGSPNEALNANDLLQQFIGPQKHKTLAKIIGKIGNKDIQPQQKSVKKPPSWDDDELDRPKCLHVLINSNTEEWEIQIV